MAVPGGMVAAVDLDGVVRWVRCVDGYFPGPVVAPLDSDPDRVLFATSAFDTAAQEWRQTWQVLSLADGSTVTTLDELVADAGLDGAATANRRLLLAEDETVVFGPEHGHVIDAATDGDLSVLERLLDVLRRPFLERPGLEAYAARRPDWARDRPGCSALSCSS